VVYLPDRLVPLAGQTRQPALPGIPGGRWPGAHPLSRSRAHPDRLAATLVGGLTVALGGYFFLKNDVGLSVPSIDWDLVWPVVVVILASLLLYRARAARPKTGSADEGEQAA
jgi:hypothetical protein